MRIFLIVLSITFFIACSHSNGTSDSSPSLLNSWSQDNSANDIVFYLQNAQFGQTQIIGVGYVSNRLQFLCECSLDLLGDEASGSMILSSCTPSADSNCTSLESTIYYSKSNGSLSLCNSPNAGCSTYIQYNPYL